ncbi:taste receptor type 2 member 40-like [Ambystoma mexicanum]|uniref:taste receptor type 2 member 40-like n=1 Tax=Ambystoma mexicanum TaxID=8296 RepID=UPI0037E8584E
MGENAFILAVSGMERVKGVTLKSCDIIMIWMSVVNFCVSFSKALQLIVSTFYPDVEQVGHTCLVFMIIYAFLDVTSLWLVVCLGVLYCAKVASFEHPLFLQLKHKVCSLVPWLIAASFLLAMVNVLALSFILYRVNTHAAPVISNGTTVCQAIQNDFTDWLIQRLVTCLLPVLFLLALVILIIVSWWRLVRRLKLDTSDLQVKAHLMVLKAGLAFLASMFAGILAGVLTFLHVVPAESSWRFAISALAAVQPFLHPLIQIFYNCKLRRATASILHHTLKCFIKGGTF